MRKLTMLLFAATLPLAPATALAAGSHSGGHHEEMMLGKPANPAQAGRTIAVRMLETDDGAMLFEPSSIAVKRGETVLLDIRNDGELEHEFVMDEQEAIQEHKGLIAVQEETIQALRATIKVDDELLELNKKDRNPNRVVGGKRGRPKGSKSKAV